MFKTFKKQFLKTQYLPAKSKWDIFDRPPYPPAHAPGDRPLIPSA